MSQQFVLNIVSNSVPVYMEPAVAEHCFKSVPFKINCQQITDIRNVNAFGKDVTVV